MLCHWMNVWAKSSGNPPLSEPGCWVVLTQSRVPFSNFFFHQEGHLFLIYAKAPCGQVATLHGQAVNIPVPIQENQTSFHWLSVQSHRKVGARVK